MSLQVNVSERIEKLLREKCTRRVTNTVRKELRDPYPLPKVPATRNPQLDLYMKPEVSSLSKVVDMHANSWPECRPSC